MQITLQNALVPNQLDDVFTHIVATVPQVTILHKNPWVLTIDGFVTEQESKQLLKLTEYRLKRSTDQGEMKEGGFQEQVVSDTRTSSNSWCLDDCEKDPVVKRLQERIANLTQVPMKNFESFQVLKYELGQKYDVHHDASENDFQMSAGPRILTFFLYFNDVEEGGETHFPRLNLKVKPKRGSALLWPSVTNLHPTSEIEPMTYHAALPVKKGMKLAANTWIHLREYKTPSDWGCTGSFD